MNSSVAQARELLAHLQSQVALCTKRLALAEAALMREVPPTQRQIQHVPRVRPAPAAPTPRQTAPGYGPPR